jgi:hypothetical protein
MHAWQRRQAAVVPHLKGVPKPARTSTMHAILCSWHTETAVMATRQQSLSLVFTHLLSISLGTSVGLQVQHGTRLQNVHADTTLSHHS